MLKIHKANTIAAAARQADSCGGRRTAQAAPLDMKPVEPSPAPGKPERIEILGVPVDSVSMASAVAHVEQLFNEDRVHTVIAVNPEKVMRALRDPALLETLRTADLLIPDGIGIVLAARLLGLGRFGRVPGSELMPRLCEHAVRANRGIYLFGASETVNERAARELLRRYPGLTLSGRHHGYVTEQDMPLMIEEINACGAELLFVALGSPRQEAWMNRYQEQLSVRVCQGVGGTFDVLAGYVRRAPRVFLRLNLEWLYRLLSNPGRLMRQTALPRFAAQIVRAKVRSWRGRRR